MGTKGTQTPWTPETALTELRAQLPPGEWEFCSLEHMETWRSGKRGMCWKGTFSQPGRAICLDTLEDK